MRPPSPVMRRVLTLVNSALALLIVGGVWFSYLRHRLTKAPAPPPPIPNTAAGEATARYDMAALDAWCRLAGHPDPPHMDGVERAVATTFHQALHAAWEQPGAEAWGRLGMICESLGARDGAVDYFVRAEAANARDPRWPYYLGCIHQVRGDAALARAALNRARQLDPAYPTTHARLGQLALDAGDVASARRHSQAYVDRAPNDSLGHVGLARVALVQGAAAEAQAHAQRAVALAPWDFQAHHARGQSALMAGDLATAERSFARAAELPQGAWFGLRDPLDQALRASSGSVQPLLQQFNALSPSTRWEELSALAEQIIARRPGDAVMMVNLASLYRKLGRLPEASTLVAQARAVNGPSLWIDMAEAEIAFTEGRFDTALATIDGVLRRDDQEAAAHALRGRCLLKLDRIEAARAALRRSLALDARQPATQLVLATAHMMAQDFAAAATAYRAVLDQDPDQPLATERLAWLARQGIHPAEADPAAHPAPTPGHQTADSD